MDLLAIAKLAEEEHSPAAWQLPVALWNYFIVSSALDGWTRGYRIADRVLRPAMVTVADRADDGTSGEPSDGPTPTATDPAVEP